MRRISRVLLLVVALAVLLAFAASGSSAVDTAELESRPDGGQSVPAGAVMFFDRDDCPPGWTGFTGARGRVIVGGPPGVTVGSPLLPGEQPQHQHVWSEFRTSDWYTYDATGASAFLVEWDNGVGNEGSGFYGVGVWGQRSGTTFFYTDTATDSVPYIQLRPCIKS